MQGQMHEEELPGVIIIGASVLQRFGLKDL